VSCDFSTLLNLDSGDLDQLNDALQECSAVLEDPMLWVWAIAFTIFCAAVGALIGKYKNAIARDALLGAVFGPFGWIASLLLPKVQPKRQCPTCKRPVDAGDAHCRHCGTALAPNSSASRTLTPPGKGQK
jgi:hypothetical protein